LSAKVSRSEWINVGGQLILKDEVEKLKRSVKTGKIKSWDDVHAFYRLQGDNYQKDKVHHAYTALLEILHITPKQFTSDQFGSLLNEMLTTREWMTKGIYNARAKDYSNPYRKMVYENKAEMDIVLGKLEDNGFLQQQLKELDDLKKQVKTVSKKLKL
jgi:hypothetical protein